MAVIERAILIHASCQDVFAYISDFRNDEAWRKFIRAVEHDPPGLAWLGTKIRETILVFGVPVHSESEVIQYEQDRWIATHVLPRSRGVATRRGAEPHGNSCRCTMSLEPQLRGTFRPAESLLAVVFRRRLITDLNRLKQVLEEPRSRPGRPRAATPS
jgi:hypothetical protein